jgi:ADP-ribose pyrophosphatase
MSLSKEQKKWIVKSTEKVFSCNWFEIFREECQMPNGKKIPEYYISQSADIVTVIAFDMDFKVLVLNEYKHGVKDYIYTFPSGMVDASEDVMDAAERELKEETGYSGDLELIHTTFPNPTGSSFKKYTFLAKNIEATGSQHLDISETITVHKKSILEVISMIKSGMIVSDLSIASFYLALHEIDRLKII